MLTRGATSAFLDKLDQSVGIKVSDLSKDTKFKLDSRYSFSEKDNSWTDDLTLLLKAKTITVTEIFSHFTTLRLVNLGIREIDVNFLAFQHLKELNLSGNLLSSIDNIPNQVEILDLNANLLQEFPNISSLSKLLHLGISYNSISEVNENQLPQSLISLDLAYNSFSDLKSLISNLSALKLKNLCLIGNLVDLSPAYKQYTISKLPLINLDDIAVIKRSEFREEDAFKIVLEGVIESLTDLEIPKSDSDAPKDEFKYSIRVEFPNQSFSTPFQSSSSDILDFPVESSTGIFEFPISKQVYGIFKKAILQVFQEKTSYIPDTSTKSVPGTANKKDKKKPNITYTPSTSEPILLTSESLDLSDILVKKEVNSKTLNSPKTLIRWRLS
jgi:hypothetical protein